MDFRTKLNILSSILILFFFTSGCKKEFFNWNLDSAPTVSEITIEENNLTSFEVSSSCTSDGNDEMTINGFCWSTKDLPTIKDSNIIISSGKGNFQTRIKWSSNPTIYIRAFSKNNVSIKYSQSTKIDWSGSSNLHPNISTINATATSFNSIAFSGELTNNEGLEIQELGFIISSNSIPSITNSTKIIINQNPTNTYEGSISNLVDGNNYYVSFYTKTIVGYSYGNAIATHLPKKYSIGEVGPGNGIVFYQNPIFSNEWNFLEVNNSFTVGVCVWAPNSNKTDVTDLNIGSGLKNSNDIEKIYGYNSIEYAAHKTRGTFNNKSDWYLPSLLELKLALNQLKLSSGAINIGGVYWTSSEDSNFPENAWSIKVTNTDFQSNTIEKTSLNAVQPIRRF